jgi:hypothetical protein
MYLLGTSAFPDVPIGVTVLSRNPSISSSFRCQRQLNIFQKRQSKSFQNRQLILSTFYYGSGDLAVRRGGVVFD